jgi:hypothetical protein
MARHSIAPLAMLMAADMKTVGMTQKTTSSIVNADRRNDVFGDMAA